MKSDIYKILITDSAGVTIADVSGMQQNFSWSKTRNRADKISMVFDLDDLIDYARKTNLYVEDILKVNVNEIHIYRNDIHKAAGQISWLNPSASVKRTIGVQASGWLDLFAKRYRTVTTAFTATDLGQIMWSLINESQLLTNGSFGITQGTIETSFLADRTYPIYKNIKDALTQASEVANGPDFEFTPDKVFNVYSPRQGDRITAYSLTYPGNIKTIEITRDGTKMANYIIANGAGTGDLRLTSIAQDTGVQPIYKLRQEVVDFSDISNQTTLDSHSSEELHNSETYFDVIKVTHTGADLDLNNYGIGDEIEIKVTNDLQVFNAANGFWRIDEFSVNVDQNELEDVTLKLGR